MPVREAPVARVLSASLVPRCSFPWFYAHVEGHDVEVVVPVSFLLALGVQPGPLAWRVCGMQHDDQMTTLEDALLEAH